MKTASLIALVIFFSSQTLYAQKDFTQLPQSTDSTYGYTAENPIKIKKGNQEKSIRRSREFLRGLKTSDGQTLELIKRSSMANASYKKPAIDPINKFDHKPLSGNLGMLDKYVFITSATKDTLTLFIDIYNKGELFIPTRLKNE
jgi:hypothetical protein